MSLIILWNRGLDSALKQRFRAVGRMALTNYLTQTILGVLVLTLLLSDLSVNRAGLLLFVTGRLGVAAVVVAGLDATLPLRSGRVAVAGCDVPEGSDAATGVRPRP